MDQTIRIHDISNCIFNNMQKVNNIFMKYAKYIKIFKFFLFIL